MLAFTVLLAASATAAPPPFSDGFCNNPAHTSWDVCNTLLPLDSRSADIVSRLSLQDKIQLSITSSNPAPSISLEGYNWWQEATHGINNAGPATNTALPITTSCAFNRSLWRKTGNQIGREARAFETFKGDVRGQTYWAPVINIVRDPRCACVGFAPPPPPTPLPPPSLPSPPLLPLLSPFPPLSFS